MKQAALSDRRLLPRGKQQQQQQRRRRHKQNGTTGQWTKLTMCLRFKKKNNNNVVRMYLLWVLAGLLLVFFYYTFTTTTIITTNDENRKNGMLILSRPMDEEQPHRPSIWKSNQRQRNKNNNNASNQTRATATAIEEIFGHSSSKHYRIPHILIFTHQTNVLLDNERRQQQQRQKQEDGFPGGNRQPSSGNNGGSPPKHNNGATTALTVSEEEMRQQLTVDNVRRTIQMYATAWRKQYDATLNYAAAAAATNDTTTQRVDDTDNRPRRHHRAPKATTTTTTGLSSSSSSQEEHSPRVWFLNNAECERAVGLVLPDLVPYFVKETIGKFQGDMCRVAALYLSGGYYMDVDTKVIQPVVPMTTSTTTPSSSSASSHPTTFVTVHVESSKSPLFFNSFIAAAPRHAVFKISLEILLQYYQWKERHTTNEEDEKKRRPLDGRPNDCNVLDDLSFYGSEQQQEQPQQQPTKNNRDRFEYFANRAICFMEKDAGGVRSNSKIGPYSLKAAFDYYYYHYNHHHHYGVGGFGDHDHDPWAKHKHQPEEEVWLLTEEDFALEEKRREWYPTVPFPGDETGVGCCCHFLVHDPLRRVPYFYSRFVGAGEFCQLRRSKDTSTTTTMITTTTTRQRNDTIVFDEAIEYFHIPNDIHNKEDLRLHGLLGR